MIGDESLFHYTDGRGLYGILNSKTLWATNILFMNDYSEGSFGIRQVAQAITALRGNLETRLFDPEPLDRDIEELESWMESGPLALQNSGYYACCLTSEGDQLSQWRGYASNGFCIEFDENALEASLINATEIPELVKVQYRDEDEIDDLYAEVGDILYSVDYPDRADSDEDDTRYIYDNNDRISALVTAHNELMREALERKHSAFKEEKETRLLITDPEPLFRPSDSLGAVPYAELALPDNVIRSVRVSPNAQADRQTAALELFKRSTASTWKIYQSSIPFRSS